MRHLGSVRSILILVAAFMVVALLLAACSSGASQPSSAPADTGASEPTSAPAETSGVSGSTLLQERCTSCHSLDRIQQAKKTSADWETTVTKMIGKGAQLSAAEKATLVEYLAQTYGP